VERQNTPRWEDTIEEGAATLVEKNGPLREKLEIKQRCRGFFGR
jgi:hypothetical protein